MKTITEGSAIIKADTPKIVSKDMDVFYNPVMKTNRDITILLLNTIKKTKMDIALPLAGSGIRAVRLVKELKKNKLKSLAVNDISPNAVKNIKYNLKLNKIKKKIIIENNYANIFLLTHECCDYIDVDPFGSPNRFLEAAIQRLTNTGILAITATDTGALAGSFPTACLRKYWSMPLKDHDKHETGIRILIRRAQLAASQFDKALTPIFSYFKDHYYRVFFKCERGKAKVDKILAQHKTINDTGPLWTGLLWDKTLTAKLAKNNKEDNLQSFLDLIKEESKINILGTLNIHILAKKYRLKTLPKSDIILNKIKKKKHKVAISHFDPLSLRTTISEKELVRIMKKA